MSIIYLHILLCVIMSPDKFLQRTNCFSKVFRIKELFPDGLIARRGAGRCG